MRKIQLGKNTKKVVYAAVFLALGLVLPFLTGQIPEIGQMLCPMHLPVMLCGFLLGGIWGAAVGAVTPMLRMLLFGMPKMPMAFAMMFELAAYGVLCALFRRLFPKKFIFLYPALLLSMLGGRLVLGAVNFCISGFSGTEFSFFAYLSANIASAIPGLIAQIVLIPALVFLAEKRGMLDTVK